jgi:hypothetical protein
MSPNNPVETATSLIKGVDKAAIYYCDGLEFQVTVIDTRYQWGRTEYLIMPVNGTGSKWVASRLRLA